MYVVFEMHLTFFFLNFRLWITTEMGWQKWKRPLRPSILQEIVSIYHLNARIIIFLYLIIIIILQCHRRPKFQTLPVISGDFRRTKPEVIFGFKRFHITLHGLHWSFYIQGISKVWNFETISHLKNKSNSL